MSKKLFIFMFVVFCSEMTYSQKIRMSDTSNKWIFKRQDVDVYANVAWWSYPSISFIKDTIINNNKYSVFNSIHNQPIYSASVDERIILRDDTLLNKVLFRDIYNDSDIILYDYNLTINDTFKIVNPYNNQEHQYKVTQVDSTYINGIKHKVWYFDDEITPYIGMSGSKLTIVEGLGCLQAITLPISSHGYNFVQELSCFATKNIHPNVSNIVYHPYMHTSVFNNSGCDSILGINHLSETNYPTTGSVSISQNPVISYITLKINDDLIGTPYIIKNIVGQMILSGKASSNFTYIQMDDFPPGMYILLIGHISQRIIKN